MFNSPFQADQNAEPQFSFNGGQQYNPQQQQNTQAPPKQNTKFSTSDVEQMVASLQVSTMNNPVKIVEPSYILTETQLKQILGLKDVVQPQQQYTQQQTPQYQPQPQYYQPQPQYVQPQYNPQQMIQPVNYQQMPQKRTVKEQFSEALQAPRPTSNNMIDSIGNVTFGTVGRIGHTFTGLIDGVIDVITMGYGQRR